MGLRVIGKRDKEHLVPPSPIAQEAPKVRPQGKPGGRDSGVTLEYPQGRAQFLLPRPPEKGAPARLSLRHHLARAELHARPSCCLGGCANGGAECGRLVELGFGGGGGEEVLPLRCGGR